MHTDTHTCTQTHTHTVFLRVKADDEGRGRTRLVFWVLWKKTRLEVLEQQTLWVDRLAGA